MNTVPSCRLGEESKTMERWGCQYRETGSLCVALGLLLALSMPAMADPSDLPNPHVHLDYMNLQLDYTFAPDGAGKVGTFAIQDIDGDFGVVKAVLRNGYGQAIPGEIAYVYDTRNFDVGLSGDVIRTGADSYVLDGRFWATDSLGENVIEAAFRSTSVVLSENSSGYGLDLEGDIHTLQGNEAILIAAWAGDDLWSFEGQNGAISVEGAHNFDRGTLVEFHLGGISLPGGSTADDFFAESRGIGEGDMKVTIVPSPAAAGLGLVGLGIVGVWLRRHTDTDIADVVS